MLSCPQCHRTYRSKDSLRRHARNHSISDSQHTCSTCTITFSRRDLLMRHLKIHQKTGTGANSGRRRCHKACRSCRDARIRCSGQFPCDGCTAANVECSYSTGSRRVSRGQPATYSSPIRSPTEPPAMLGPETEDRDLTRESDQGQRCHQPLADLSSGYNLTIPDLNSSVEPGAPTGNLFSNPVDWPWIHENLFLQPDSSLNLELPEIYGFEDASNNTAPVLSNAFPYLPNSADGCTSLVGTNHIPGSATPTAVIQELMKFAVDHAKYSESAKSYWHMQASQVAVAFRFQNEELPDTSAHWLHHFVGLFMTEFHELWPIFRRHSFDPDRLHPVLYLTLASIGAMYGSAQQRWFGTLMHEHTRKLLATTLADLRCSDDELTALAQARLFSQVSALYFGQTMGFSYAQHLGAILVGQVRRMGLLSEPREPSAPLTDIQRLEWWTQVESRKRLALAILRADIYTSVLLNTWPLIPAAELELGFPSPATVWDSNPALSPDLKLMLIREDQGRRSNIPINESLRMILELDTPLFGLGVEEYESIIFALQQYAWRQRHRGNKNTPILTREDMLAPEQHGLDEPPPLPTTDVAPQSTSSTTRPAPPETAYQHDPLTDSRHHHHHHHSNPSSSQANHDRHRLLHALHRWKRGFDAIRTTTSTTTTHRTTVLSALLLYHLTYLRLLAPLSLFQHLAHSLFDGRAPDPAHVAEARAWARGGSSSSSLSFWPDCVARHACAIVELLDWETSRRGREEGDDEEEEGRARARFNFLSFAGLHHAAVVIWVYAGARAADEGGDGGRRCEKLRMMMMMMRGGVGHVELRRERVKEALAFVTEVHGRLGVARASSFQAASEKLSRCEFPL